MRVEQKLHSVNSGCNTIYKILQRKEQFFIPTKFAASFWNLSEIKVKQTILPFV
jgi:hypothetical protein